ncbi:MAG: AAA family ATPase, partial [Alistipes sp.]|nr:AAA family ATPase [Alistipes sp.]
MELNRLKLSNFRNYAALELEFAPGVNLIVGDNAQGKTNLLEAIAFLGTGKSFRTQKAAELVRFSQDFADIEGEMTTQGREQSIRWVLFPGTRPRMLYRNGVKKKTAAEIGGMLPSVLFCPEDLQVLRAGAAQRRRFGDLALCQLRPNYEG